MTHAATSAQPGTNRLRQVESYQVQGHKVELFVSRRDQDNAEPCSMDNAIAQAAGLLTDMDNEEYIRGMCELLASMFPAPDTGTEERAEWFTAEVEKKLNANNAASRARA